MTRSRRSDGIKSLVSIGLNLTIVANPLLATIDNSLLSGTLKSGALGNIYEIAGNPSLSACAVSALKTTLNVAAGNDESGANFGCIGVHGRDVHGHGGWHRRARPARTRGDNTITTAAKDIAWMKNVTTLDGRLRCTSTAPCSRPSTASTTCRTSAADLTITNNVRRSTACRG